MYNPMTSIFEASTVPKGPRRTVMVAERQMAPLWNTAAAGYINSINPALCAEDAVEFNFETEQKNRLKKGDDSCE